ncbi:NAD(+) diphosphatase [Galbitalea soli]|uniref:NAD(+) diphosphatase n=1 Tax=Galbitalea soli TaxID=1268042 RepID=A0A7C9PMA1_9MICO|nr:NAD(+) diphosphatase [Galbitalea soli]NEM90588.1 NAD(+) diphosphatase [Galbitalea soli]NYJ31304.1 NAD+ diphosphatase [Galbitalea soli]
MTNSFLSRLPLSRYEVDRDYLARERENLFDELWADPATRVLPIFQGTALLSSPSSLALLPVGAIPEAELRVYLGRSTSTTSPEPVGTPIVAVLLADAGHLAESEWGSLRALGTVLSDRDAGILTEALGILNWHASHAFSPRTGEPTLVEKGGWVRRDPVSGTEVFPRTDAAIIVGVTDADDRLLLGSNALWESNRFSLLAGFVEPGESLEAAVVREVFEESGIRVTDPVYLGSQPWPFPASLMLGFMARVDSRVTSTLTPDGNEILALRWFSREELRDSRGEIMLPGSTSIAHAIIEEWYGEPITDGLW